jgi:hypothetical protein
MAQRPAVSARTLIPALTLGTIALTALGVFIPEGPITVLAASVVGTGYAWLARQAWANASPDVRYSLDPRTRWPNTRQRQRWLALAAAAWLILLVTLFATLPAAARPAVGALNITVLWAALLYWLPQPDDGTALTDGADESTFTWLGHLLVDTPSTVNDVTTATVVAPTIPFDRLQAAWEAENRNLDSLNPGHGPHVPFAPHTADMSE